MDTTHTHGHPKRSTRDPPGASGPRPPQPRGSAAQKWQASRQPVAIWSPRSSKRPRRGWRAGERRAQTERAAGQGPSRAHVRSWRAPSPQPPFPLLASLSSYCRCRDLPAQEPPACGPHSTVRSSSEREGPATVSSASCTPTPCRGPPCSLLGSPRRRSRPGQSRAPRPPSRGALRAQRTARARTSTGGPPTGGACSARRSAARCAHAQHGSPSRRRARLSPVKCGAQL